MRFLLICFALAVGCGPAADIIYTTTLGDTSDLQGPYEVTTVVSAPGDADKLTLFYQVTPLAEGRGPLVAVKMREVATGLFQGAIPGHPPFTQVRYFVELEGSKTVSDPPGARGVADAVFTFWVRGEPCEDASGCGAGQRCDASGVCRAAMAPCDADVECGRGFLCVATECRLASRSCTADAGCLFGELCDPLLEQCIPRPACEEGCPVGYLCGADGTSCLIRCAGSAECWSGARCAAGICAEADPCSQNNPCNSGLICDVATGQCRKEGAAPCAPCTTDSDCGGPSDHCLPTSSGMRCGQDCSILACPAGYACSEDRLLPQCISKVGCS